MEKWVEITGFEGLYEISTYGRVKSITRYVKHNYGGLKVVNEKILSLRKGRYKNVMLCKNGQEYIKNVHRMVAEGFIPNPLNKPQVNHKDGDSNNNNVDNLEWVTVFENQLHAIENDLFKVKGGNGKNPYSGKNIHELVRNIKQLHENGVSQKEISLMFGVHQSTISRIFNNKRWTKLCHSH